LLFCSLFLKRWKWRYSRYAPLEASEEDIIAYICHKLEEDTKMLGMTEDFKKEIIDEIVATSQGMLVYEYLFLYNELRADG
jgi:hypothetical protein